MPLDLDDQQLVDEAIADSQGSTKLLIRDPAESQKLGWFDVICTILNRTIGASFNIVIGNIIYSPSDARIWYLCHTGYCTEEHQ